MPERYKLVRGHTREVEEEINDLAEKGYRAVLLTTY